MSDRGIHLFGRPIGLIAIVVYKTLWGLSELALAFFFFTFDILAKGELLEDPQDIFINWVIQHLHLTPSGAVSIGTLFFVLGLTKLLIAVGLWRRSWKIRQFLIVFLCVITFFAGLEIIQKFTWLRGFGLSADLVILFYLWKILPKHLHDVAVIRS